jgi:replicative DNA helicase
MSDVSYNEVAQPQVQSLPHSRQAEEAVLGAILIDSESYFTVAQFLKPDDFYIVRNRWIWEACTRLHERRGPIDYLTVCEALEQQGQLGEVGGPAYIMSLINQTPSSLNAEAYAHLVEENSVRRRMLTAANELARLAYDQKQSVDTIMDEAEKSIFSISERRL